MIKWTLNFFIVSFLEEEIGVIVLYPNVLKAAVHSSTNLMSILKTAAAATII